jgi:ribosomal protein S19E (S16A)
MTFSYNDSDAKWTPDELKVFNAETKQFETVTLAEDEEPNKEKLNDLKNALDDLKIVDVERKPDGLSKDLKANQEFANNREALQNLAARGFIPVMLGDAFEVLSNEGEVLCQMKDGVEYVLRFGKLVVGSGSEAEKKGEPASERPSDDAGGEAKSSDSGIHRYLFVTARFKEATIPQPKIEALPELPPGASAAPAADAAPPSNAPSNAPSDATDGAEGNSSQEPSAGQEPGDAPGGGDQTEPQNSAPSPAAEGESSPQDSETAQQPDSQSQPESKGEAGAAASGKAQEEQKPDKALEDLIKKRKEIETENQRKLDEYQDKIKKGKDREKELNDRFGDWYYVISDEVYRKIHLGRDDVIQKKEAEKKVGDAAAPGAADVSVPEAATDVETGDDAGSTPEETTEGDTETEKVEDPSADEDVTP